MTGHGKIPCYRPPEMSLFAKVTLVKKKPLSIKNFTEGGVKEIIHTPPNILEGSRVVFETFTVNNLQL